MMKGFAVGIDIVLKVIKRGDLDCLGVEDARFPAHCASGTLVRIDTRFLLFPEHGPRYGATASAGAALGTGVRQACRGIDSS